MMKAEVQKWLKSFTILILPNHMTDYYFFSNQIRAY